MLVQLKRKQGHCRVATGGLKNATRAFMAFQLKPEAPAKDAAG
jgi:hypothetical protein